MKQLKSVAAAMLAASGVFAVVGAARADGPPVSIQLNIGAPPVYAAPMGGPPPLAVAAPSMVWVPELGAYIALGLDQPVFFFGGVYYYFYGGAWYSGPQYGGPWHHLNHPPHQFRHFDARNWGHYQDLGRQYQGRPNARQFQVAPQRDMRGPGGQQFQRGPDGQQYQHGPAPQVEHAMPQQGDHHDDHGDHGDHGYHDDGQQH